ncbi:unnamed protein product [Cuscuta epithymum]|uniref:Retrotransposon gag domain-containing protein n=1 Tax=Cuscuta epithymum TaxID=186058 RepID=A0AAV0GID3_9ASTE|nr:unnamed protein product [Cuscuta epithymum]
MDCVHDLWADMQQRFEAADGMRFHELKQALQNCKQAGDSVTAYFGRLKTIWDDFDGYRKIPTCTCGGCTCNLEKQIAAAIEKEKTHEFLLGLDGPVYGSLRSNLLSNTTVLPGLSKVYQMMIQEERLSKMARTQDARGEAAAFVVRSGGNGGPSTVKDKGKVVCSYCKKEGHERDRCFKLTGEYPDWWYANKAGRGKERSGGSARDFTRKGISVQANATLGDSKADVVNEQGSSSQLPTLTGDQWNSLLEFVKKFNAGEGVEKLAGPNFEDADWSG